MQIYTYGSAAATKRLERIIHRGLDYTPEQFGQVAAIINDVRKNGDSALEKYSRRFDAPALKASGFRVTPKEIDAAAKAVDKTFLRALNRAVRQVTAFHALQVEKTWVSAQRPGVVVGQKITPVDSAGIYVPGATGGQTPLVSTVIMGAIPAKTAGVRRVVMVTPPRKDGTVNPHLLVAAKKVGVNEIYKIGSAWAIAALAYGTKTVGRVDMIAGPGNIYVALAKKIVAGAVGIDMVAGPSEILVIADSGADPGHIAADLLSQAEHDTLSAAVLVTTSQTVAKKTEQQIKIQLAGLSRGQTAEKALSNYGAIFVVKKKSDAFALANRFAPEHLELHTRYPFEDLEHIRNAGAVFLGGYTPEPIGDYVAGPNHTLPTSGCARFSSALSTGHFLKKTSIVSYSKEAFMAEAADVMRIATVEGLDAHANAVGVRLKGK
ncbi:MAG: histidinol dehydrogenase [Thermodesulfobacteriota bacterium]